MRTISAETVEKMAGHLHDAAAFFSDPEERDLFPQAVALAERTRRYNMSDLRPLLDLLLRIDEQCGGLEQAGSVFGFAALAFAAHQDTQAARLIAELVDLMTEHDTAIDERRAERRFEGDR